MNASGRWRYCRYANANLLNNSAHNFPTKRVQFCRESLPRKSFCPAKMLQNLLYFYNKKTRVVFLFFISSNFILFPNECPGLCRHRPGHSLVKKIKLLEMKNEKTTRVFLL